MNNFLEETVEAIKESGHTAEDIVFIGSLESGHSCSWNEFQVLANQEYNSGFGSAKVAQDLVIAFKDNTYMKRGEYDGSEWWEFNPPLKIPEGRHPIKRLFVTKEEIGWLDLKQMNK